MAEDRFLLVRLGSMGDIIHALPSAAALREAFPEAQIDWAVEPRWTRLLKNNPDVDNLICVDRKSPAGIAGTWKKIRAARYTCAIDFQALYKSALLAFASGAPRRIGFKSSYAREGLAAALYTQRLNPRGPHKVDHNLTLVGAAGARKPKAVRFHIAIEPEDEKVVARELSARGVGEYFVLNPGGGWVSKCWPAAQYGQLHRELSARFGWRGVVIHGPGEKTLAREVVASAGDAPPVEIELGLGPLMALLKRTKFVVSADTGPLHLASALSAPVIGLYGPTDPSRNGPYSCDDVVVRNARASATTYNRESSYSEAMLSITVEQVVAGVERRLGQRS